jgi:glycosyltransferase involved in cell wall biosynthesis
MHILFDGRMIHNTGVGRIVQNLISFFPQVSDISLTIIVNDEDGIIQPSNKNITIRRLKGRVPIYSISEQFILPIEISNLNPDLIHFPNFNLPILERHPFITTINDLVYYLFPDACRSKFKHLCAKYMISQAVKRAKKIITISHHSKKDLLRCFDIPEERVAVIYPGVDTSFFYPVKDQDSFQRCKEKYGIIKKFIFYTGNHEPRKNLLRLIKAYSLIKNSDEYQLVIGGKTDPRETSLYKYAEGLDNKNNIIFTNFIEERELALFYNMAEAFVFPSLYEGFGLPPLEAMACGTPVICSHATSLPEVANDAALLFDPLDEHQIKEALEEGLFNNKLRSSLIEKGKKRAEEFKWSNTVKELLQLYNFS